MLRTPRIAFTALATAALLVACGTTTPSAAPSPSQPSAGLSQPSAGPSQEPRAGQASCPDLTADGKPVHFGSEIASDLYGLIFGSGGTGIVIAHMRGDDVCMPTPYAKELVQAGYRVMVFDFAGFGVSTSAGAPKSKQVASAAAVLRADGASRIVLLGGSMGATASLAAAPLVTPPPAAVVALSPPLVFGDDNAADGAKKLAMPVFYAAGELESQYPNNIKELDGMTPKSVPHTMMLAEGSLNHGLYLTDPGTGVPAVRTAILQFLRRYAPAS